MRIADHINKITYTALDKFTFVLYGIAMIVVLQITDKMELGLFTLFNNLHNFILAIASYLGLQAMLQFSANEEDKPVVSLYSMINFIIVIIVFTGIFLIFKDDFAVMFNEPNLVVIANRLPLLSLFSIVRYYCMYVMYRELLMKRLFVANLVYFGVMSGIIFYCAFVNRFLIYTDMIDVMYLGSFLSASVAIGLTRKYWKFGLTGVTKYLDVVKFSAKYSITGVSLSIPRTLDVYAIQYFFGAGVVGLYAPAKTIFRFVEDAMLTVFTIIYSPTVKYFANNDINSVNKLISKVLSWLVLGFIAVTIICWLGGSNLFYLFLPQKFINAIPFFNMLMLSSIVLPFTILNSTISAEGKTELVAGFVICGICVWFASFVIIGTYFADNIIFAALPNIMFNTMVAILFLQYAYRHYQFRPKQLLRAIPDGYNFLRDKIHK